jgi:tol-pal system protein YbgF
VASADPIVIEDRSLSGSDQPAKSAVAVAAPAPNSAPPAVSTPAPTPAAPAQNANWELYQQVQQLQDQVQQLQGTVEEQNHTIERLRSDDKSRYGDLDQRLNSLNDKFSQLQQNPAPAAASGAAASAAPTTPPPAPSGNVDEEKKAYLAAYDVFRSQGPDKAIPPMLAFVGRYPGSIFTPNAYYWLGEFYLAANPANMAEARRHFETVLSKYPSSPKAAAALYKLGTIADMQNRNDDAKKIMQDVLTRFPSSPEAALAQAYLTPPPEPAKPAAAPAKKKKAPAA